MSAYVSRFERRDRVMRWIPPMVFAALIAAWIAIAVQAIRHDHEAQRICALRGGVMAETLCIDKAALR